MRIAKAVKNLLTLNQPSLPHFMKTPLASAFLTLTIAAATGLPLPAQILTESFSHSTGSQANPSTFPISDTFTFSAFNPNLGTLRGVELSLQSDTSASVDVYNSLANPEAFTNATASIPITVSGLSISLSVAAPTSVPAGTVNPGLTDFAGLVGSATNTVQIASNELNLWEGTSGKTVSLSLDAGAGTYGGTSVPGVFFSGSAKGNAITTLTYTYAATPEPAPWVLASGAAMLFAILRIRQKRHVGNQVLG